jgi:superfamily II DNA/RNA helicase
MHRVGRTARGVGNKGYSLSFVTTDSSKNATKIKKQTESNDELISYEEYLFNRILKRQEGKLISCHSLFLT